MAIVLVAGLPAAKGAGPLDVSSSTDLPRLCDDGLVDQAGAERFAADWARHWNNRDLDALLDHFSDDVLWTSPVAAQIIDGSDGVVRGKPALRAYYSEGLRRLPNLRFEVVRVYRGVDTMVINYRNQNGALVNEVLSFDGDLVREGHGTYADDPPGSTPGG